MKASDSNLCDRQTFERIYILYAKDLYRFLSFTFRNQTLMAEDVVQSVFLKLWDECHRFELNNIKSLIYTMGKNLSLNHLKKNKIIGSLSNYDLRFSESPQDVLEEKQFKKQLLSAINDLSEKERVVFLMNRIEDLPYREIAERLEISQKTVEKRMHLALKKLNDRLSINLIRK